MLSFPFFQHYRLKKECLKEIDAALKRQNITLSECYLTTHDKDPRHQGVDNYMRRQLEQSKTKEDKYVIEFWINELEVI